MNISLSSKRMTSLLVFAFFLGCAAQAVTTRAISAAQTDPTRGIYRECFAASLYTIGGSRLSSGQLPELVTIPAGWYVAGGGGPGTAVLCR
jgi:hypothetical protein